MNTKKQIFKKAIAFFALATILLTTACSKSDSNDNNSASGDGFMKWTLNGTNQQASVASGNILPDESYFINGFTDQESYPSINLTKAQAVVGTINIDAALLAGLGLAQLPPAYYTGKKNGGAVYYETTIGSVTISEISATRAKGTFRFKATNGDDANDKIDITNGEFDIPIKK
jgi:Family of unknown function (DUF6252)